MRIYYYNPWGPYAYPLPLGYYYYSPYSYKAPFAGAQTPPEKNQLPSDYGDILSVFVTNQLGQLGTTIFPRQKQRPGFPPRP